MGRLGLLTVLLHICIPFFGQSKADQSNPNSQTEEFILGIMKNEHIPGLSIAIVKNNQLILSKGYGFANLENNVMASEKSMYGIASVTKVFTAIAVMLLVEDKKLSLNDTIGKFLSSVPDLWKPITIKQLLNHTSGISSFSKHSKIPCSVGKDVREYERGDAWKEVACLPLDFRPGERWSYGDTGYYLLGLLIEKISNKRYEDFLKERILSPLNMDKTRLISYKELIPLRADGYSYANNSYSLAPRFEIDEFSNGGILSNVLDMAKLHEAFTSEKILRKSSWKEMWNKTILNDGTIIPQYGLGFGLTPFKGKERIGHNGGGGLGFSTALTHFPGEDLTIILLTNVNLPNGRTGELVNQIASYYFK